MRKMKKGVSLVTVLLFMMVATIAATATYKWVSSIGSSSAARLQMSEARQAALSGIEAARSWMTFNGNDLGAVIKQYFDNGKKPILLNSVLPRMNSSKMRDSVWLMGVNVENSSRYKVKIVSLGTTRENVKYSEVAIFNVNGLYQVEIPTEEHKVNYKEAFHGGLATADVIEVSSAFIKQSPAVAGAGGQALNSINVDDGGYLILDGNFYVNNRGSVHDLYVTGDLSFGNNLSVGGNMYVGGVVYGTSTASRMSVSGSSYLKGGMRVNNRSPYVSNLPGGTPAITGGQFDFYGNVTSDGDIDHFTGNTAISYIKMHENLVLNGKINFPPMATTKTDSIRVMHNAFIRDNSISSGNVGFDYMRKTLFGTSSDDKLYLSQFGSYSDDNVCGTLFQCAKSSNDKIYVAYKGHLISMPLAEEYRDWNADSMIVYRDMISAEKYPECGFSKDRIQFNTGILSSSLVHSASARFGCSEDIWKNDIEFPVTALNTCFNTANDDDQLLDKTWLIVKWDHAPRWKATDNKLSGNFIFIINSSAAPTAELELPETNADAKVMVYLPDGWKNTSDSYALKTNQNKSDAIYNYFIYSVDDIGRFETRSGTPVRGSVYMQGCSQLNTLVGNNTLAVRFNESLFRGLVKSSILCEYDGSNTCSEFSGAVISGFAGLDPYQTTDPYHISTSPQLIVEVESQYKNKEPLPQSASAYGTISPSEVVLPRVIYLPRDAWGRLSDYYNVVGLNVSGKASRQRKVPSKMQCPNEIPTGESKLMSNGGLTDGKYLCSYGDEQGGYIPVYVVVEGSINANSEVKFHPEDENKEISSGTSVDVRLVASKSDVQIALDITVPYPLLPGWNIEPIHPGLELKEIDNDHKLKIYTLRTTPSGDDISLFRVSTTDDAQLGGVDLNLKVCDKCIIRSPTHSWVFINNRVKVIREEVDCSTINTGDFEQAYKLSCSELQNIPSCGPFLNRNKNDDRTWVTARGSGCFPLEKNNEWNCYTGGNQVYLDSVLTDDDYCTAYIPPKSAELNSHKGEHDNGVYTLPASLKRKRSPLVIKIEGPNKGTAIKVEYQRKLDNGVVSGSKECLNDICEFDNDFFAGDTVYLSRDGGSGRFSYWTCSGKSCNHSPDEKFNSIRPMAILKAGPDTVTAWFGQKDAHCFYTNFENFKSSGWCTATDVENDVQCIDKCKSGTHCSVNQGQYGGNVNNSDWLMVYSNNGSSYKFPQINYGRLKHPAGFGRRVLAGTTDGDPSVILNRVQAGANGVMTAMLKIPSVTSEVISRVLEHISGTGNLLINDGLIFRSNANATEYFTLNIIAHEPVVYARLCYVQGQENKLENCHDVQFKTGFNDNWAETANRLTRLTLNVDVNGSIIRVILSKNYLQGSVESGMAVAEFDLDNPTIKKKFNNKTLNDDAHQYVGVKIGYPYVIKTLIFQILIWEFTSYEIYDVGWRSYDYDENCWDTPKVSCSFKPKYTGGMVPDSTDVTPWVGMSSWFEGKNCQVTYYYNGCDLDEDHFAYQFRILRDKAYSGNEIACRLRRPRGMGLYNFSGRKLETYGLGRLRSDKYWFEDEGYHGYPIQTPKASGFVNEASVVVSCMRDENNDNMHIYDASCGDFIVGEYEQCSESYPEMLSYPKNCYATDGSCFVELDTIYNVREANVSFTFDEPTLSAVEPYLVDVDSNLSLMNFEKVGDAEYLINVESVSDAPGFNPQNLRGILFKNVSRLFTVNHVQSRCRYAFSLECKDSKYNFLTKKWTVSASVVHPERAETCEIIPLEDGNEVHSGDIPEPQACGEDFVQFYDQDNVYGQFVTRNYAFKVVAKDIHGEILDECETSTKTYDPFEVHCSLSSDTLEQGFGVPLFRFSVENCPPEGCPYTITYPAEFGLSQETGVIIPGDQYQQCPGGSCSSINTEQNKLNQGVYEYQLDVMGHSCPIDSNKFFVAPEPEKGTCSDPKIETEDGNEYFVANIGFGEGGYWKGSISRTVKIVYTDYLGNVIDMDQPSIKENVKGDAAEFKYPLPKEMFNCEVGVCKYLVSLLLYGGDYCTKEWKVRAMSNVNSNCPAIESQSASAPVEFKPLLTGCEDAACKWSVKRGGDIIAEGTGYDGNSLLSFTDGGMVGTKAYTFTVSATDDFTSALFSCDFNVTYTNDALSVSNCGFLDAVDWGGEAEYTFTTNCANCDYEIKSTSGAGFSGKTSSLENDATTARFKVSKLEQFDLKVNGVKVDRCSMKPTLKPVTATCDIGNGKTELYSDEPAMFKASFNVCTDGSCSWPWVLKKNNGELYSETVQSNGLVEKEVVGGGTYALYLNGSNDPACTIEVNDLGETPSGMRNCRFEYDEYAYGATGIKFMADNVYADKQNWSIKKGNTEFNSGYWLNKNNESFSTTSKNGFKLTNATAGTYEFKLSPSGKSCTAELKMKPRSLSCERKKSYGGSCYLEVTPSGCENGCKVKYVGASSPYGPVDVRNSMKTIYGPNNNSSAHLDCSSNWKVFFEDDTNKKYDCGTGVSSSSSAKSSSSSAVSSSSTANRTISCSLNQGKLTVNATGCNNGCKFYYKGKGNEKGPYDINTDPKPYDVHGDGYDVYFADDRNNKSHCGK